MFLFFVYPPPPPLSSPSPSPDVHCAEYLRGYSYHSSRRGREFWCLKYFKTRDQRFQVSQQTDWWRFKPCCRDFDQKFSIQTWCCCAMNFVSSATCFYTFCVPLCVHFAGFSLFFYLLSFPPVYLKVFHPNSCVTHSEVTSLLERT